MNEIKYIKFFNANVDEIFENEEVMGIMRNKIKRLHNYNEVLEFTYDMALALKSVYDSIGVYEVLNEQFQGFGVPEWMDKLFKKYDNLTGMCDSIKDELMKCLLNKLDSIGRESNIQYIPPKKGSIKDTVPRIKIREKIVKKTNQDFIKTKKF